MLSSTYSQRRSRRMAVITDPFGRNGGTLRVSGLPDWVCDDLGLPRGTDARSRRHFLFL